MVPLGLSLAQILQISSRAAATGRHLAMVDMNSCSLWRVAAAAAAAALSRPGVTRSGRRGRRGAETTTAAAAVAIALIAATRAIAPKDAHPTTAAITASRIASVQAGDTMTTTETEVEEAMAEMTGDIGESAAEGARSRPTGAETAGRTGTVAESTATEVTRVAVTNGAVISVTARGRRVSDVSDVDHLAAETTRDLITDAKIENETIVAAKMIESRRNGAIRHQWQRRRKAISRTIFHDRAAIAAVVAAAARVHRQ